ncbi:HPr kinase/phosphorylase [Mesorhizobium sp.]|uniref:HPr kinase/phosphatase C-terminal domain-containing protein n=1 Tax=Mesorhizobium sp. TaxID=1871066 RepID=UPI0025E438AB|nr:HPr kinase/phosphorylase [Mesorhizobium sp.]
MPQPAAKPQNIHATAILVGRYGVLITGPSGSGKTTLALALIDHCHARGLFCRLIGDDQVFAAGHHGRLVCSAPATIAGLAEVPGIGPRPLGFEPAGVIDLAARLVPGHEVARFQEESTDTIAGCLVPRIDVVQRNVAGALPALAARLSIAPFL